MSKGYHIREKNGLDYYQKGKATFMVKFNAVVSCENGVLILEDKECGERWYFKNGICIKKPKILKENHG